MTNDLLVSLPASVEAENAVIGAMFLDKQCLEEAVDFLSKDDFYHPANAIIFEAIQEVHKQAKPVDMVTVVEQLQKTKKLDQVGGVSYLSDLVQSCPTTANNEYYMGIVKDKSNLRKLYSIGKQLQEFSLNIPNPDEAIDKAESMIFGLATSGKAKGMEKASDFIYDYYYQLEARSKTEDGLTGIPTGMKVVDKILAGLQRSDLIIVAGRPSMGKTAFALNIAENVCENGGKVNIFSLEMSKEQLLERLVCSQSKVSGEYIRTGNLTEAQWKDIKQAMGRIKTWDLYIDDKPNVTVGEIRSKLRKSHAEKPIDLVVIDYLQLINYEGKAGNKADAIGEVTKAIKQLARELDCPIILLSQLNRGVEAREDKRPMMSDLRDSGAIEQDADVILFLYRDEYYNPDSPKKGIAEVIVSKQRKGATGTVELAFFKNITKFQDLGKKSV